MVVKSERGEAEIRLQLWVSSAWERLCVPTKDLTFILQVMGETGKVVRECLPYSLLPSISPSLLFFFLETGNLQVPDSKSLDGNKVTRCCQAIWLKGPLFLALSPDV